MSAAVPVENAGMVDPGRPWVRVAILGVITAAAIWFLIAAALPYLVPDELHLARYASRRPGLLLHIACGTVALLVGPVQLWLGPRRTALRLHRGLGSAYATSVALGSASAFYLAFTTRLGWVVGTGLAGLGLAWLVTTGLAVAAVRRRLLPEHAEWMIRSYVVTFAFVTFRMVWAGLRAAGVGTLSEQLAAASWFCWSVPLLLTEMILQGRKILVRPSDRAKTV
jgi:hypothetical protein